MDWPLVIFVCYFLVIGLFVACFVWSNVKYNRAEAEKSYGFAPEDAEFYVQKGDYKRWIEAMYRETPENERNSRALYDVPRLLENERKNKED